MALFNLTGALWKRATNPKKMTQVAATFAHIGQPTPGTRNLRKARPNSESHGT